MLSKQRLLKLMQPLFFFDEVTCFDTFDFKVLVHDFKIGAALIYGLQICTLCIPLCWVSVAPVFAESKPDTVRAAHWQLKAKPRICVTPVVKRLCTMSTDFIWVGTVNADICLLSSQTQQTIQCWHNVQQGDVLQEIVSDVPITYWLSHFGEDAVLAETSIRIITVPQRQIRRRRRHIWSLL